MKYHEEIHEMTFIDKDGNETTEKTSTIKEIGRSTEPDYIKLYTNIWCEFNGIPIRWRDLFLYLACEMSYANSKTPDMGQIVYIHSMMRDAIMKEFGWKESNLKAGIKALVDCNAIRRLRRGIYQINPTYAGRGDWKYNPKLDRGGIENIRAMFDFAKKTVETEITFVDNDDVLEQE